jgi:hypothetical protein
MLSFDIPPGEEPPLMMMMGMKTNMPIVLTESAKFQGISFTRQQIDKLCNHLSVDSMRANPSCNNDSLVKLTKSLNENEKTAR